MDSMEEKSLLAINHNKGGNNYVLMGNTETHWVAFQKNVIEKLIYKYKEDFNLIIYWRKEEPGKVEYVCVPYRDIKHLLVDEHLSDSKNNSYRWTFIIKDGLLCVHANMSYSIDISSYENNLTGGKRLSLDVDSEQEALIGEEGERRYRLHKAIERDSGFIKAIKEKRKSIF